MKSIIFNTEMVQATLNGTKTLMRRVEEVKEIDCPNCEEYLIPYGYVDNQEIGYQCVDEECQHIDSIPNNLKYKVDDILYVKETFFKCTCGECEVCRSSNGLIYKADFLEDGTHPDFYTCHLDEIKLSPSLFMKKVDARLFLKVTKIRLEKLVAVYEFEKVEKPNA